MNPRRAPRPLAVAAAVAALVVTALLSNGYERSLVIFVACDAIAALGLNVCFGFGGKVSWAQAAFMGAGAYTAAILTTTYHMPMLLALAAAIVVSAMLGLLVGLPTSRMQGHYLAIATIAFLEVVSTVLTDDSALTKGVYGVSNIAPIGLTRSVAIHSERVVALLLVAVMVLAAFAVSRIRSSPTGLALRAMRDDELAAQTFGVSRARYNTLVFVTSAVFAGLAGCLYADAVGYVSPDTYSLTLSINIFVMVLVGGTGTIVGPILGAVIIVVVPQLLESLGLWIDVAEGVLIIVFLVLLPGGLVSLGNVRDATSTTRLRIDELRRSRPAKRSPQRQRDDSSAGTALGTDTALGPEAAK